MCADLNSSGRKAELIHSIDCKVKMEGGLLGLGDIFSPSCCFIAARMCLDDVCKPCS